MKNKKNKKEEDGWDGNMWKQKREGERKKERKKESKEERKKEKKKERNCPVGTDMIEKREW